MLARISGVLETVSGNTVVVGIAAPVGPHLASMDEGADPSIAYEALVPSFTAIRLESRRGERITLHTIQYLEQQAQGSSFIPRLIGFETLEDRGFFELFTTVKGVGTKKALRALAAPAGQIARAIASRDAVALQKLPEIGKRLAETIVAELHGKVDRYALEIVSDGALAGPPPPSSGASPAHSPEHERAIVALVRLGESRAEAQRLIQRVIESKPALEAADEILAAAVSLR